VSGRLEHPTPASKRKAGLASCENDYVVVG
jgi:hypothetical protein